MSIYQILLFCCEVCGKTRTTVSGAILYDDPVIVCPNNEEWDYTEDETFACPECLKKENNNG